MQKYLFFNAQTWYVCTPDEETSYAHKYYLLNHVERCWLAVYVAIYVFIRINMVNLYMNVVTWYIYKVWSEDEFPGCFFELMGVINVQHL